MSQALSAYANVQRQVQSPRELEASVLMKAATRLQGIRDNWEARQSDLDDALVYNRKLWTILFSSVIAEDNPLPVEIKRNVAQIANYVFNHTLSMITNPEPERLGVLITINRDIAAGLRQRNGEAG